MSDATPEFSRLVSPSRIPPSGVSERLDATAEERKALRARFDLLDMPVLQAFLELKPDMKNAVEVTGKINATIIQNCILTLEPITTSFDLNVQTTFLPSDDNPEGAGSPNLEEGAGEIEYYPQGGKIDLGEMVAQHLGVSIDLYPRKPGATLNSTEFGAKVPEKNPFAKLAKIQDKES